MDRRLISGLALAAGLSVTACGERPQEPSLQEDSGTLSNVIPAACSPNSFNSLIAGYFENPQMQLVKNEKDAMIAALQANNGGQAKLHGFNILREISSRSKAVPQPTPATGSALAVEVLECIYEDLRDRDVIEATPGPGFFTKSLDRLAGGGFEVRGGEGDPTSIIRAVAGGEIISGVAPPEPETAAELETAAWWNESLDGQRVLFYGEPDEDDPTAPQGYHWSVVPRAAEFAPPLVFTTCVDDAIFGDDAFNAMQTESGVGVLAFTLADYICVVSDEIGASTGQFGLLPRLASLGRKLFLPQPAAAAAVMPGTVGGSAKTAKSLFDVETVDAVQLSVFEQPPKTVKLNTPFTVQFQAKTTERGPNQKTVNGTLVRVVATNNNGVPTTLKLHVGGTAVPCGENGCEVTTTSTDAGNGIADFRLSVTSTGAVILVASGEVNQRQVQVLGTKTNKFNVKP